MTDVNLYPISELFGPTIQGEGALAGRRSFFVRVAGCDSDCSWCDTKYAVGPKYPGWHKDMMSAVEILTKLASLGLRTGDMITLTGGNPALFIDRELAHTLGGLYKLSIETQGTVPVDQDVLLSTYHLVISPKPPSSRMESRFSPTIVKGLIDGCMMAGAEVSLKFVAFDGQDLDWILNASDILQRPNVPRYLSVGSDIFVRGDETIAELRECVCDRMRDMFEIVAREPAFSKFIVFPQLHTLAWGRKRGV